jgi:hypothetical protein
MEYDASLYEKNGSQRRYATTVNVSLRRDLAARWVATQLLPVDDVPPGCLSAHSMLASLSYSFPTNNGWAVISLNFFQCSITRWYRKKSNTILSGKRCYFLLLNDVFSSHMQDW